MRRTKGLGIVATDAAPKAIGPYSQAVTTDGMVYTAGQVPLDPKTGELVGKTAAEQTEQVFRNLEAVLAAAGSSLANVGKTTVYLTDMADFAAMNEVYAKHFGTHKPARSTAQAAGLPRSARVGIEVIAVKGERNADGGGPLSPHSAVADAHRAGPPALLAPPLMPAD